MTKINLKKTRWIKYYYEIQKAFELSAQQTMIYGYLYNHCQNLNDDGYCGYSDQKMADELNVSYERFRKELAVLKNKKLIVIKNPQKRAKKANESRMIYINTEIFLEDVQMDLKDIENDNLKKEIQMLRNTVEEQERIIKESRTFDFSLYVMPLVHLGVINTNQYEEVYRKLGPVYYSFAVAHTKSGQDGYQVLKNHFRHIARFKKEDLKDPVAYLYRALEDYRIRISRNNGEDTENDGQYDDENYYNLPETFKSPF